MPSWTSISLTGEPCALKGASTVREGAVGKGLPAAAPRRQPTSRHGPRPGYREGKRLRKRYVWYREEAFDKWPSDEADRYNALPRARLGPLIFRAIETPNHPFLLYTSWEQAVKDLAKGLARMRALLQEPAK